MNWIERLAQFAGGEIVARAVIAAVNGPTPRAVGTSMLMSARRHEGRIGRPDAMVEVLALAHDLMAIRQSQGEDASWLRARLVLDTGPVLGEATGGEIVVLLEVFGAAEITYLRNLATGHPLLVRPFGSGVAPVGQLLPDAGIPAISVGSADQVTERIETPRRHFHVYGTGLAAQALVRLLASLPFDVYWHDSAPAHFPRDIPEGVIVDARFEPATAAREAEPGSFHAVMTSDHALDLDVSRAVLAGRGFGYLGVIGSRLKRDRMLTRLKAEQIPDALLARIACPMGLSLIRSKSPPVMALSIAAEAMIALEAEGH